MSYTELFAYMDKDNSNLISVQELVKACSPDIDNNNIYDERELRIGKQNAKVWIATILELKPNILNDNHINKIEFKDLLTHNQIPHFYKTTYDQNGYLEIKDKYLHIFETAENILKKM